MTSLDQHKDDLHNNPPFYQHYKDTIPIELVEWINKIVSEQDLEWEKGAFGGGKEVNDNVRKSEICWIEDEKLSPYIFSKFKSANTDFKWRYDLDCIEKIQYTKYKGYSDNQIGDHYDWHRDYAWKEDKRVCRKLGMTLMLSKSDDYEGGSFEFQRFDQGKSIIAKVDLEIGDILVFPSTIQHRVNPVTSGERRVLVAWAWGPLFR